MGCSRDRQAWAYWGAALPTKEGRVRWEPVPSWQARSALPSCVWGYPEAPAALFGRMRRPARSGRQVSTNAHVSFQQYTACCRATVRSELLAPAAGPMQYPILETLMKRISGSLLAVLTVSACAASTAALADNLAGFYAGAGVGYSTIRSDDSAYGLPGYFNDHQTAWKLIAGVRPISILGAEFEYIDFGQPGHHSGNYDTSYYGRDSHPRASVLFAMGYLPLPIPFFDVYGKAGIARLQ